jgi:hypothetical protein
VLTLLVGTAFAARLTLALPPGLAPDVAAPLRQLAERATVVGHVEGVPFRLPGGVFEYLLDHPEFAAHVAQALKIGNYRVWRASDGMWLDDGRGAVGRFSVVYAAGGSRIIRVRGRYKRPYVPTIHGEAVALLAYTARPVAVDRTVVAPALTGFVRIDGIVVETLSRLLNETAKNKAERLARRVVADFAQAAEKIDTDPLAVVDELKRCPGVRARELDEFNRLLSLPRSGAS